MPRPSPDTPVPAPFTILIDTREQLPYVFVGLRTDARTHGRPLTVPTRRVTLATGDYSLDGYAARIAVERKSLADLYGTLTTGRDRFERELSRLNALDCAHVVVESTFLSIVSDPPRHSKVSPKSVWRSIIAYVHRFPRVHWWPAESRDFAERTVFRILERYHLDSAAKEKQGPVTVPTITKARPPATVPAVPTDHDADRSATMIDSPELDTLGTPDQMTSPTESEPQWPTHSSINGETPTKKPFASPS